MNAPTRPVSLPEPQFPMVTRMISNALFPAPVPTETLGQRASRLFADMVREPHRQQALVAEALHEMAQRGVEEPVTWTIGQPHPLVPSMTVVRMFVDGSNVEIYSLPGEDKSRGVRNLIPMGLVRLIEEVMPIDVFADELAAAESGGDDDDDPPDDEPEPEFETGSASSTQAHGDPGVS